MPISEFELIEHYFAHGGNQRRDVALGIGDDAAMTNIPPDHELIIELTRAVEGIDFDALDDAADIAHGVLARTLTALAARAAEPAWLTLALTMPEIDQDWLQTFSQTLHTVAAQHGVQLIGGDTTRGPRSITLHGHGFVPNGQCVVLDRAVSGDLIYVTGTLGDAGLAILALSDEIRLPRAEREQALQCLHRPVPPLAAGIALRGLASSAAPAGTGISTALVEILRASDVGATVHVERLPLSSMSRTHFDQAGGWSLPLHGPAPSSLCVTVQDRRQAEIERRFNDAGLPLTWVGTVDQRAGLRCVLGDGTEFYSDP